MKQLLKRLLAALLVLAASLALSVGLYRWDNKYTHPGAQPIAGVLFVAEEDWVQTPLRFLWNGWQFYPNELLSPATLDQWDPSKLVPVRIGEYNDFAFQEAGGSPNGCGSYLLTLELPDAPHTYALELPEVFSAYRLYIDDQLVLEMGNPTKEAYRPLLQNRIVTFTAKGSTQLLLAVRDESHFYSGLVYPPAFGEPQAVNTLVYLRMCLCAVAMTATLLFALLALWISIRTSRKQQPAELFFLLCLSIGVFISYSLVHFLLPMEVQPWYTIELVSAYLPSLLIILLHNRLCGAAAPLRFVSNGLSFAVCLAALLYGAFAAKLSLAWTNAFSMLAAAYKIAMAIYLLMTAFVSLYRQNRSVTLLFYADLFYAAMLLLDRLLPAYEPMIGGWFQEWGCVMQVAALGVLLWQEVALGYRRSLTFREEQRQMERQMGMQQEHFHQISHQLEETRKLRHDFRHHLHAITGLAGDEKALLAYIGKIASFADAGQPESYCNNTAVDALLYYYVNMARKQGILVDVHIELPEDVRLPDNVAFCTLLGNLMENAVEACQCQRTGKPYIQLYLKWQYKNLYLLLENSYDGIVHRRRDAFLSRKHKGEGIGTASVREVAQRLGGSVEFLPKANVFQARVILPPGKSDN